MVNVCLILGMIFTLVSCKNTNKATKQNFWIENYFQQDCVITPQPGESVIKARVDGEWNEFNLVEFPEKFMEWDVQKRIGTLDRFMQMKPPELAGPHNGIVATYGCKERRFSIQAEQCCKGDGIFAQS